VYARTHDPFHPFVPPPYVPRQGLDSVKATKDAEAEETPKTTTTKGAPKAGKGKGDKAKVAATPAADE